MAITFSFDNDRIASGIQNLTLDQTAGVQAPPDGDDINVFLTAGQLDGLDAAFETYLASLGLSAAQKDFAVLTDAASSSSTFIQVTPTAGEQVSDLRFSILNDPVTQNKLVGVQTLAGEDLYFHVDASGNFATLTTAAGAGGRIVAAFALTNEVIDAISHVGTAGVQWVTFEALKETNTNDNDESLSLSDVLQVTADASLSFNFSQLDAGNFLWAAVGDSSAAMLITGQDLNVKDTGSPAQIGNIEKGGSDPSDAVNTSKATETTIGINAQHFADVSAGGGTRVDGAVGVFTFVTGYQPLAGSTPTYTGQNVKQIDYNNYMNISAASVFISQLTGGSTAKMSIALWEAGGGGTDKAPGNLLPEEGYSTDPNNKYSYIGNQDTDSNLKDDIAVNVASVTIGGNTWLLSEVGIGAGITKGGITVAINGNVITVNGAHANDLISFTAVDNPASAVDGTFNRITIQPLAGTAAFDIGHIDLSQGALVGGGLGSHLFVDDDGPTISGQPAGSPIPNDLQVGNAVGAMDSSAYILSPGTDGFKSFSFVGPADSSGDWTWQFFDVDGVNGTENNEIKGFYKGAAIYTLELNDDGTYTFKMIGELPNALLNLNVAEIKAGAPDTNSIEVGAIENDQFIRISGDSSVGTGNINESHAYVGIDNGNLDIGETLIFSLHEANGDPINFLGMSIGTKSAKASDYHIVAHLVGGGTYETDISVGKNGVLVIDPPGGVLVSSIEVTKLTGPATKIGLGDIDVFVPPNDVQLGFTVQLIDGDDDPMTASFTVDIDGNNDGNYNATVNALLAPISSASLTLKNPGLVNDSGLARPDLALGIPGWIAAHEANFMAEHREVGLHFADYWM